MHGAGNTNTLAGNVPPKADLGDLRGLAAGLDGRHASMINGGDFDGAKAYKDSKVRCSEDIAPIVNLSMWLLLRSCDAQSGCDVFRLASL